MTMIKILNKFCSTTPLEHQDIYCIFIVGFIVPIFEEWLFRIQIPFLINEHITYDKFWINFISSIFFSLVHSSNLLFVHTINQISIIMISYQVISCFFLAQIIIVADNYWYGVLIHIMYNTIAVLYNNILCKPIKKNCVIDDNKIILRRKMHKKSSSVSDIHCTNRSDDKPIIVNVKDSTINDMWKKNITRPRITPFIDPEIKEILQKVNLN